jgi:glycosyltransferase involved in cell wall biosynthesis
VTRSRPARIAILQNHIGFDGRTRAIAPLVRLLNERGVVPDLVTYGPPDAARVLTEIGGEDLEVRVVRLRRIPLVVGDLLEELVFPYSARRHLQRQDGVIASCTGVHGFRRDLRILRMICFPLEQVPAYESRYKSPVYRLYGLMAMALYRLAAVRTSYHGSWVTNSRFTRSVAVVTYPIDAEAMQVVYPPASRPVGDSTVAKERLVVSVGGFHPDKRQLEQIDLARALPEAQFLIIGSVRSRRYFERCRQAAAQTPNVTLLADAAPAAVEEALLRAKVFLHMKENEHFGISTVEGILHGCIPVTHDSGGQREVVPDEGLRFSDAGQAAEILRRALAGDFDARLPSLQANAEQFTDEAYAASMSPLVDELLAPR